MIQIQEYFTDADRVAVLSILEKKKQNFKITI